MRTIVKKSTFEKIREPQIVGNPGTPAHMDLVKLDSGEIPITEFIFLNMRTEHGILNLS